MEFCDYCSTMLVLDTEDTKELMNICTNCGHKQPIKNTTKIYEEKFDETTLSENLLKYACDNIVVPRKMEYCPTCKKEEIVSIIRKKVTLKEIYICCKCKNYWS